MTYMPLAPARAAQRVISRCAGFTDSLNATQSHRCPSLPPPNFHERSNRVGGVRLPSCAQAGLHLQRGARKHLCWGASVLGWRLCPNASAISHSLVSYLLALSTRSGSSGALDLAQPRQPTNPRSRRSRRSRPTGAAPSVVLLMTTASPRRRRRCKVCLTPSRRPSRRPIHWNCI